MVWFEAPPTAARLSQLAALLATGMMLTSAARAEVSAGVSAGVSRSDNIRRVQSGEKNESVGSVNVNFDIEEKSARSRATAVGDLSYLNYFGGTFDDEVVGRVAADAALTLWSERLELFVTDTFGQEAVQSFAAVTPENRENVNVFTAGPRLRLGGESQLQLQLGASFSMLSYEESLLDNDRVGGDVALIRRLSSSSTVSLNGDYEDVDYDDDLSNTDFDRTEGFVRYAATGNRTELSLDVGVTQVGGDIDSESGFLGRLQLSRRVSPSVSVSAGLGRELSDAGNSFEQLQSLPTEGVGTQSVQNTSGPFTSNFYSLGVGFDRARVGFSVSGSVFDEQFDDQPLSDRTRSVIGISARRDLTPVVRLSASAQRMEEDYEVSTRDFNEVYATVALSWQLGASLGTLVQFERFDRDARTGGSDYVENRISVRAAYNFGSKSQTANIVPVQTGMFR